MCKLTRHEIHALQESFKDWYREQLTAGSIQRSGGRRIQSFLLGHPDPQIRRFGEASHTTLANWIREVETALGTRGQAEALRILTGARERLLQPRGEISAGSRLVNRLDVVSQLTFGSRLSEELVQKVLELADELQGLDPFAAIVLCWEIAVREAANSAFVAVEPREAWLLTPWFPFDLERFEVLFAFPPWKPEFAGQYHRLLESGRANRPAAIAAIGGAPESALSVVLWADATWRGRSDVNSEDLNWAEDWVGLIGSSALNSFQTWIAHFRERGNHEEDRS